MSNPYADQRDARMTGNDVCPVCHHDEAVEMGRSDHGNRISFQCPRCGSYTIGRMAIMRLPQEREVSGKLSAWIREHAEFGRGAPTILQENLQSILSSLPGRERADQQRLLLGAIHRRTANPGQVVSLQADDDYPLGYAQDGRELRYLLRALQEQRLIRATEAQGRIDCEITPKGWEHLDEERLSEAGGSQEPDDQRPRSDVRAEVVDVTQHRFDVALSFPGEHRPYVERVAAKLGESLGPNACFYDKNYRAQLAAPNADLLLQAIYRERSDLVVAFICREYDEKKWCGIEWRKIRERLSDGGEAEIMYVRLGSGDVEGMTTLDGYVDAREEERPEAVAGLIVERLQVVKSRNLRGRDRPGSRVGQTQPDMDRRHEGAKSESHAKVVAAVEALGQSVKVCQEVFSGAMTALNLLTASELDDIFHGRHVGDGTVEYMLEEYRDITFINRKTDQIEESLTGVEQMFVSERLWELYGRFVQIHGRLAFLFCLSFKNGAYVDWRSDTATLTMMRAYLDEGRLTAATSRNIGGVTDVVGSLYGEFVKEARNLLRDPQSAHAKPGDSPR